MYLDPRLWALTRGVRGRIAASVVVGLAAVAAGIARLVLLGWLLARVLAGESLASLTGAIVLTAAAVGLRSLLDSACGRRADADRSSSCSWRGWTCTTGVIFLVFAIFTLIVPAFFHR